MKKLLAIVFVFLTHGCTTTHITEPYKPVETARFQLIENKEPVFSSRKESDISEGPLTLSQAIDIALQNNPQIAIREWAVSAASAYRQQQEGKRLPSVNIVSGYGHTLDSARLIPAEMDGAPGLFTRDVLSGDMVLTMPLFTGGRIVNQAKAAECLQQAASHQLSRTGEEIVFNVSIIFYHILAQKRVIDSLAFSERTLSEHIKRMDALITAQKAAKVDRMRTEVRLADIQQISVREKNLLAVQHRTLSTLLGQNTREIAISGELDSTIEAMTPDPESALATAWQKRSDYLAARSAVEAKALLVDAARADNRPTISLQGAYGGRWSVGHTAGSGNEQADVGRLGVVMEIPLFDGGQADAGIREQTAGLAAEQERLRAVTLQVRLDVETALLNIESSRQRAYAIEKSIAQAKEGLRIEQQKYDLGKGAIVDVLDAQNALLDTETTYYRTLAEFHTALAQLRLSIGE